MYMIASAIRWVIDNFNLLENEVNNIIQVFTDMGNAMYSAGENIVTSLIDGVKSRASQLIETVSTLAQSVRDFFPFSPAKRGPLMDIHRIKLVETIAQSVRPAPLLNAMSGVAASVMSFAPVAAATPMGGGGNGAMNGAGISVVYSPNITISGTAAQGETANLETVLRQDKYAFEKMLNEILADRERRKF
jgi:phage-related protein